LGPNYPQLKFGSWHAQVASSSCAAASSRGAQLASPNVLILLAGRDDGVPVPSDD